MQNQTYRATLSALVLATGLLLATTLDAAGQAADSDVVAQRGGLRLTVADVRDLLDHLEPAVRAQLQSNPTALANFVRERLLRLALLAEAKAKGFDLLPDVVAKANDARDGVIVSAYAGSLVPADPSFPSQAEITAAYETNKARFALPRQFHLAQIVMPLSANAAPVAAEEARRRITDAHTQAVKPKADFAELTRKLAADHNAIGGDLGWVREDQLQPALRGLVSGLSENAVSEPAQVPGGWVMLKLLGTRPPGPAPLADVQDQLVAALRQSRAQQASQSYVNEMLQKEPIQLNEIDLSHKLVAARAP